MKGASPQSAASNGVFDRDGWLSRARRIDSPNQDERPEGVQVTLLVLHNISLPPGQFGGPGVIDFFLNRLVHATHPYYAGLLGMRVSSHFFLRRDGELVQFVPCERRAWHAGASRWQGRQRCNDFSIGIELEGTDELPYSDLQYAELALLTREIGARYPIQDVAGHSDIAPGRKTDPGPSFDWVRYRRLLAPT